MSKKLLSRLAGYFISRTQVGVDKAGNRYFTRKEEIDGILFLLRHNIPNLIHYAPVKEKRWVIFKGEEDSTSIPVEWICWLNGQRKKAPTPEEMIELDAKRERVKQNVELLKKKEEEERKSRTRSISKVGSPDLKSFIQQFPDASSSDQNRGSKSANDTADDSNNRDRSSEPTGSGKSFKPGTWQPPT